jgi:hypothetical protein
LDGALVNSKRFETGIGEIVVVAVCCEVCFRLEVEYFEG